MPNVDSSEDSPQLESLLFESTSELATSKGYEVASKTGMGLSMLISRPVEVFAGSYILDVIPLLFNNGRGRIRYDDDGGGYLRVVEGESDNINELCRDLVNKTERLGKTLFQRDHGSITCEKGQYSKSIVQGLESCSVNMILGRINYSIFNGKNVGLWVMPVFLTSSYLQDQTGNLVPWIPFQHGVSKGRTDIVSTTSLASYLDFRDREVRILGRELLSNEGDGQRFPDALRFFRILSVCVSIMLIAAFFIFDLNGAGDSLAVFAALGLAAFVEAIGGLRLIKSYHNLQRNKTCMQKGSPSISAEQIAKAEKEFPPDERPFLYWKYGGVDLSKLRKETNLQRIDELEVKSKESLSWTGRLENDELYSEAILSYDRALRTAMTAVLVTMGMETQANEIEESFPVLRRVFENMKLEDIRYLKALKDRVNKGYDATKIDSAKVRDITTPLIEQGLEHVRSYRAEGSYKNGSLPQTPPKLGIPKDVLNAATAFKFLLDETEDNELLEMGPEGARLLEAKKELQRTGKTRKPMQANEPRKTLPTRKGPNDDTFENQNVSQGETATPMTLSDELTSITDSLDQPQERIEQDERKGSGTDQGALDTNLPINKVMPFGSLGDFRKAVSRSSLPIVASYLSDDEVSREVENMMNQLVKKYYTRAFFISVDSEYRDIAIESKIKSYPAILVFREGKIVAELKSIELDQLDRDLSEILEPTTLAGGREDDQGDLRSPKVDCEGTVKIKRDNGIGKV